MVPRHRLLTLAALVLAASFCPAAAGKKIPESDPFGRLAVDQVERRLDRPDVFVFDGNPPDVYAANHLPGAVRVQHQDITVSVLPRDKDATLVFYCMNEL